MHSSKQSPPLWKAITFGQSTDLNFCTGVLPGKTGVNGVWPEDWDVPLPSGSSSPVQNVIIESRGGKIQPVHDGLTFYYTEVPAGQNFILSAHITLLQLGPEDQTAPNGQEACGLMFRDIIGPARQNPFLPGYEEYPAASNMAMLSFATSGRTVNCPCILQAGARYGVHAPSGNPGVKYLTHPLIPDIPSIPGTGSCYQTSIRCTLERRQSDLIFTYTDSEQGSIKTYRFDDPNVSSHILTEIDSKRIYAGFFAARNAKLLVRSPQLICSPAAPLAPKPIYHPEPAESPVMIRTSSDWCCGETYCLSTMADRRGRLTVKAEGSGDTYILELEPAAQTELTVPVNRAHTTISMFFIAENGRTSCEEFTVTCGHFGPDLYVSPHGSELGNGSPEDPLTINAAVQKLLPGGTIHMAAGVYPPITIPMTASGTSSAHKRIRPEGSILIRPLGGQKALFILDSNYWEIEDLELDGQNQKGSCGFLIHGNYNTITGCKVHHTLTDHRDAGFMITTIRPIKAFWPSNNKLIRCESYENHDKTDQNADGFSCRTGAGDGNCFIRCISHHNSDDGFDLYNNINDGPNGPVLLEHCIAFENHCNGFKLGGEGQEAAHTVKNCISFRNGLNGFSDNFNPGRLLLEYNTAYDNGQFNFLMRPSPYKKGRKGQPVSDCILVGNVSFRTEERERKDGLEKQPSDFTATENMIGNFLHQT